MTVCEPLRGFVSASRARRGEFTIVGGAGDGVRVRHERRLRVDVEMLGRCSRSKTLSLLSASGVTLVTDPKETRFLVSVLSWVLVCCFALWVLLLRAPYPLMEQLESSDERRLSSSE